MLSVTLQCYKIVFCFWRVSYSWSSHRLERRIAVEQLERREAATATGSWIAKKENAWRGNFHWSCLFPTKSLCLKVEASDKGGLTFGARLHWEWNAKVTRGAFWRVELFVRKERRRNVHNCICPARSCTHPLIQNWSQARAILGEIWPSCRWGLNPSFHQEKAWNRIRFKTLVTNHFCYISDFLHLWHEKMARLWQSKHGGSFSFWITRGEGDDLQRGAHELWIDPSELSKLKDSTW